MSGIPLLGGGGAAVVPEGYTLPRGQESLLDCGQLTSARAISRPWAFRSCAGAGSWILIAQDTPLVAVVNEQFANHYWPKQDALGKRFHMKTATGPLVQIVGIAKMAKYFWIAEPPQDFIYLPYTQEKHPALTDRGRNRCARRGGARARAARSGARDRPQHARLERPHHAGFLHPARRQDCRTSSRKVWRGLGVHGLDSGMVGLYGLISYSVSRRRREIGIRMAIGADRPESDSNGSAARAGAGIDRRGRWA